MVPYLHIHIFRYKGNERSEYILVYKGASVPRLWCVYIIINKDVVRFPHAVFSFQLYVMKFVSCFGQRHAKVNRKHRWKRHIVNTISRNYLTIRAPSSPHFCLSSMFNVLCLFTSIIVIFVIFGRVSELWFCFIMNWYHLTRKLEKIWFFGVKSWFFTRNTLKIFAPPSVRPP
jgi:hypothetical protein